MPTLQTAEQSIFRDTPDATNHTVSIHTSTQGSVGSKISLHKAKLLATLTMEVGDLNRAQNNGVNALFSANKRW